ncbi:MAG: Fic family protein [Candidatus Nitronauta litoralis]|uniref:Fic family protein n=1 Tax=Candidatus Nitronauta litoralis TaxID=2705533 RepID=A0A7T0G1M8_9BACT|nr:MAG: Fic family protein [Candidatus Nitronauta litoralis]
MKSFLRTQEDIVSNKNFIRNTKTGNIIYNPPSVPDIASLIQNWGKIVNTPDENRNYSFIKCAMDHYQFEAIHPFLDGK